MIDYKTYRLNGLERITASAFGCACCFVAAWLMYRQPIIAVLVTPLGLLYPRLWAKRMRLKRNDKLRDQFREALQALSSLLAAGRSVENAFFSLEAELIFLTGEHRSDLLAELRTITNRMRNGERLETALRDFAQRSDMEDMRNFAEVIAVCKKSGGDLVEVVRQTAQMIGDKMESEQEIAVLVAQKKFECRIMMGMPFAFVGALGIAAEDYMRPLHEGLGLLLLTGCLVLFLCCCRWMSLLMDIRI